MAAVPHAPFLLWSPDFATEVSLAMSSDPSTAEMVLPSTERAAIDSWLMDMDGVLVHEQHMIPGADRFLSLLRERERPFLVLTNNSLFTRRDLSARLKTSGLDVPENAIWTSALATARFLGDQRPGGSAFVIGEVGLTTALHASGYTLTEQNPEYVVIGETRTYSFSRITQAIRHIAAGARFIATNPDPSGPSPDGPLPATGSLAAMISSATGVSPYYVGKPNPLMMRTALNTINAHSESTAMIGDSMKTDIVSGLEAGLETILVLTGVTSPDDVDRFTYRPSRIVNSIADLVPELEASEPAPKRTPAAADGSGGRNRTQPRAETERGRAIGSSVKTAAASSSPTSRTSARSARRSIETSNLAGIARGPFPVNAVERGAYRSWRRREGWCEIAGSRPPIGVDMNDDKSRRDKPEDQPHEPGAEGGSGGSADVPPAAPSDDDSALGDTDQHSDAQA